jgi:hypothetical protein
VKKNDRVAYRHKACGTEMSLARPWHRVWREGMLLGCSHCDADAPLEHYEWLDGEAVDVPEEKQ